MESNMILVMVDECGDEIEVERYHLSGLLDPDEVAIWKERKIAQASERWQEARGFFFEDRRNWDSMINAILNGSWY